MKASQVNFTENEIVIIGAQSPKTVRLVLTILLVMFLLAPIAVAVLNVTLGDGLHISLVPITFALWAFAFFFLKSILWNTYGKEIITLTPESIEYIADYKYFKGSQIVISAKDLAFTYIEMEEDSKTFIINNTAGEVIQNVLPISVYHTRKLESTIEDYYRKLA